MFPYSIILLVERVFFFSSRAQKALINIFFTKYSVLETEYYLMSVKMVDVYLHIRE